MSLAPCTRPGCPGQIEDGYCDVCGMAPPAGVAASATAGSGGSARTGSASRSSGRTTTRSGRVSGSARGNLGAGLVEVPPVPYKDPSTVVLADPQLPEGKRSCGACGQPVGRARDGHPGRTEGFCPHCGHPFSFTPKLRKGDLVAGQYEVAGPIAHGGLGWIYLATDRNVSDRWVVLKGLLDSGDPSAMAAAFAERRFLAQVEHPNIVRIYNFVTHDSAGYIVMEYAGGASLKDLRKPGPLPAAQAIAYVLEMLPALGYLHGQGLLYCDFKPDNVIQSEEQLKLIDLGGVRAIDDDSSDLYGTVGYQAPEVPEAGATISSDLYTVARALAVLCFEFRGFQDPQRHATSLPGAGEVPVLARYEALDRWLRRGAHPDPAARFESAGEMAGQLLGVLRQVVAVDGGRPEPAPSRVFTAELLTDVTRPAWQDLPAPAVDPADPAAGMLAGLAGAPPDQLVAALGAGPPTLEARYQLVRAQLLLGDPAAADVLLAQAAAEAPGDWRAGWWAGIRALAGGRAADAGRAFAATAGVLPGELAPLLAMGQAAETEGTATTLAGAGRLYGQVAATDPGYAGAAFGLARVRTALGDRHGASQALGAVPARSSFHAAAQAEQCRVLLAPGDGAAPGEADVTAAAGVLNALAAGTATRLELTRALLVAVLDRLARGATLVASGLPSGVEPTETGVRAALEATCRALARQAPTEPDRVALVDEANAYRPRTLL